MEQASLSTPSPSDSDPEFQAQLAAQSKEGRSTRDMVLSLAVLIVPIALFIIIYKTLMHGDAPITVDPGDALNEAQQSAGFPVLTPHVGSGWSVTSAGFQPAAGGATLRIGYVDPGKDPIQLIESGVPVATLLPAELTTAAKPVDEFRAANGVWRLYNTRPDEEALVLSDGARTVIVIGKAGVDQLEDLASSLT